MSLQSNGTGSAARVAMSACDSYDPAVVCEALSATLDVLGGISAFVQPGQTVLIKPNLLSPRPPDQAVTTHPAIVSAMVRLCREAGAARVWVGDSCAGSHSDTRLWEKTGMTSAVPDAGGELRSCTDKVVSLPCSGRSLPVPDWLDEVDTVISLPKLKTHFLTTLTCALKNVYGLVAGQTKSLRHGDYPSPQTMSAFLLDVFAALTPGLSIVDAVVGMQGNGPANGRPVQVGLLIAGTDAVAVDSVCAQLYGLQPEDVPMVRMAHARGLGECRPDRIELLGTGVGGLRRPPLKLSHGRFLQRLPRPLYSAATLLLKYRPGIKAESCVRCGVCAEICSQNAISVEADGRFRINRGRCIVCMCCMESCPQRAIEVTSLRHWLQNICRGKW